jgi:hypothetical protein
LSKLNEIQIKDEPAMLASSLRRLWWQICYLDFWSSQEHGDPMISSFHDTQFPRNINDDDFRPDSIELPEPIVGCEGMKFSLFASGEVYQFQGEHNLMNFLASGESTFVLIYCYRALFSLDGLFFFPSGGF